MYTAANLKCETKILLPFLASRLWKCESLRVCVREVNDASER